ncbi:MAG TPA: endo-1,4-beta-xylanase, partial [Bacteroidota bacterium]
MSSIRADFATYWNQVTPEDAGKWGSVEGSQGNFNWTPLDNIYNFAISNSFPYKHHNLVWGNQQPSWITLLDSAGQRAAVDHWIDTVAQRYGSTSFVDVVNEPFHAPPSYMNGLGGTGKTGWDWVITAFQMARKYFFHGIKLLLNEYNVLQDNGVTTNYIALIDTLRVRGLIDGIGIQGHYFEFRSPAGAASPYVYPIGTLKSNLDRLAATGLPVYISEFDINEAADTTQLQNYQTYFPLFWENPGVRGITLWGYVQGLTWQTNAYLVRSNGTERPALKWIRKYLATPQAPLAVSPVGTTGVPRNPRLVWRTTPLAASYRLQVSGTGRFTSTVVDSTIA